MDGGSGFRARFGLERNGVSLLAEGSYPPGSEIKDGYPEFNIGVLKKLGWDKDLTPDELGDDREGRRQSRQGRHRLVVNRSAPAASSGSRSNTAACPTATARRARSRGIFPIRSRSTANRSTRRASISLSKYPTLPDAKQFRLPNIGFSVQKAAVDKGIAKQFPLILSSGRLVEYEGGGEETRSNKWLAELQQDMFIEINPADAADRGIKDGGWVWVTGAENGSKAQAEGACHRARRQRSGLDAIPFRRLVRRRGSARPTIQQGSIPIVLGESANTITTYGYDPATGMQEPKVTLCQIRAA